MKTVFMSFMISMISLSFVYSQTSVSLKLPNPCTSVGIQEIGITYDGLDFTMSPNPTEGLVSLRISSKETLGKIMIEIVSLKSENLLSEQVYCSSNICIKTIDLSNISKGIYVISVIGDNHKQTGKLVIK